MRRTIFHTKLALKSCNKFLFNVTIFISILHVSVKPNVKHVSLEKKPKESTMSVSGLVSSLRFRLSVGGKICGSNLLFVCVSLITNKKNHTALQLSDVLFSRVCI